jgi:hypothetical protein
MWFERRSKSSIAFVLGCAVSALAAGMAASAQPPSAEPCTSAEYRQFDFWIGDWDAFKYTNPTVPTAHVRVERILDGCSLLETYDGASGEKGRSFSIFDQTRGVWHQSWVTNRGELLTIEGKLEDGAMVLAGADRTADGRQRMVRGTWKPVQGGMRETAVTSLDGGATWTPWFDLLFRQHAAAGKP